MNTNVLKFILLAATTGGAFSLLTVPAATAGGLAGSCRMAIPHATPHSPRFVPSRQGAFARQAWRVGHPARFQGGRGHQPYPGLHHRVAALPLAVGGAPPRGPYPRMAPTRWRAWAPPATRLAARSTHRPGRYDPYAAWRGPAPRQAAWAPPGPRPAAHYRWRPVQPPADAFDRRFAERDSRALPPTRHYRFRPWDGPRVHAASRPMLAGFPAPHPGRVGIPGPTGPRTGLPHRFRPLGPGAARPPVVAAFARPASSAIPLHGAPGPFGFRPLAYAPRQERPLAGLPWNPWWSRGLAQADPRLHYRFRPDPRFRGGQWSRVPAAPQPEPPGGQGRFFGGDRLAMAVTALGLPDSRPRRGAAGDTRIH